jgi:hypothetical protein
LLSRSRRPTFSTFACCFRTGNTAPPVVYGQELYVINPALNWYVEHAWLYDKNPLGSFDDWNPEVTCPQ